MVNLQIRPSASTTRIQDLPPTTRLHSVRVQDRGWERNWLVEMIYGRRAYSGVGILERLVDCLGTSAAKAVGLKKVLLSLHQYDVPVIGEPTVRSEGRYTEYTYKLAPSLLAALKAANVQFVGSSSGVGVNLEKGLFAVSAYNVIRM